MNSYMRQTSVPADQMHSFLKDKQAWENAIALYQGPDPLDHWWNYICWYENHGHGDPDNKFRETLERCLTLFEHSDYYKQDLRMVRLWLKYIDMQNNPLHFYQVLHQRGVGKQAACFYIGWATYYESVNSFKEAEAVYNLAFQEKAQPYADLHHAHSKLMYTKSVHAQTQQQLMQQQQQQSHHPLYTQQQPANTAAAAHIQPKQTVQVQQYRPQVAYHHTTATNSHQTQTQQSVAGLPPPPAHPPVAHSAPAATVHHQPQQPTHQIYHQPQQPAHNHYNHYPSQQIPPQHVQQHQVQVQTHQHLQQQQQMSAQVQSTTTTQVSPQVYNIQHSTHHQTSQSHRAVPVEQQLPAATTNMTRQQYERALEASTKRQNSPTTGGTTAATQPTTSSATIEVVGLKTTRKFAAYCRNNHETWQPALFLEEPDDPQKLCYYAKSTVYPQGLGIEYSPEEIRARRYKHKMDELKQKQEEAAAQELHQRQQQQQHMQSQQTNAQVQEIGTLEAEPGQYNQPQPTSHPPQEQTQHYYVQQQEQRQQLHHINNNHLYYLQQHQQQPTQPQEATQIYQQQPPAQQYQANHHHHYQSQGYQQQQYAAKPSADDEEEEYAGAETEDQDDDNPDTEEDDQQQQYQNHHQRQQLYQHHQLQLQNSVNTQDDLEDQIEASTIRFSMHTPTQGSQNKTLKIKFKKERPTTGTETPNGNNSYSAYTIERIYQPGMDSPSTPENVMKRNNGNNHSFHPYLQGQTSTPKTSAKRQKSSKLKKASNKFNVLACHNSNSSSVENGHTAVTTNNNLPKSPSATSVDNNKAHLNATFNDNANYSFSSAVALDNSNCSLTTAVDRLNFRDASALNNQSNAVDISTYQENSYFSTQHDAEAKERRLAKALETIERHMAKEAIDPFSSELCRAFLTKLDFPGSECETRDNYKIIQTPLPKIINNRQMSLADGVNFNIDKEIGRGSYGSVYKATDVATGAVVALKFQKPANTWEIYICDQVLKRIRSPNILPGLMDISTAIIAPNASIIATEFSPYGSLLDINNKIRQATTKVMHESLVMHFSAQICNIIRHLHQNKIIHADIKPDNFLLMRVPSTDLHFPSLRLIDFGCAIDMTLFPDGDKTKFRKVIQTDGFTCIEMQEGRSWSYETDLFCIAGTVHVMLFGEYMQLQKRADTWDIKQKLPRYLKKHVWTQFFGDILNIKSDKLPDLSEMRNIFEEEASRMDSELQKQMRALSNILHRR